MNRLVLMICASTLLLAGCRSTCCRKPPTCANCPPGPVIGATSTTPEILLPSRPATPAPLVAPAPNFPPPPPPTTSGFAPMPEAAPSRIANVPAQNEIRLEKPEFSETAQKTTTTLKPTSKSNAKLDLAPVEFVAGRIATGRRPTLDDLDRLQVNGFRTFIDLNGTTATTSARRVFDARHLELRTIEPSDTRALQAVEQSSTGAVAPVYVFADDVTVLRAWWQSYFREVELNSDDAAKIRAARLIP